MNTRVIKIAHLVALCFFMLTGAIVLAGQGQQQQQQGGQAQDSGNQTNPGAGGKADQRGDADAANANSEERSGASRNMSGGAGQGAQGSGSSGMPGGQGAALSGNDRRFVMAAAMSGMKEVELSRLATQRASSDAVKQFAQRMVEDHTRANQELMQLAAAKGISLPTAPDARLQGMMSKMGQSSGADFDSRYIKEAGVKEHEKALKLLQRASTSAGDPDLRAFAARTLPVVQEHLNMARALSGNAGRSGNTNSSMRH